jgi:hypothetical protein
MKAKELSHKIRIINRVYRPFLLACLLLGQQAAFGQPGQDVTDALQERLVAHAGTGGPLDLPALKAFLERVVREGVQVRGCICGAGEWEGCI